MMKVVVIENFLIAPIIFRVSNDMISFIFFLFKKCFIRIKLMLHATILLNACYLKNNSKLRKKCIYLNTGIIYLIS